MQVTVDLQDPFSFSLIPIIILFIILAIPAYLYWKKYIENRKPKAIEIKHVDEKSIVRIQKKYIKQLVLLKRKIDSNKISMRRAYQRLSKIIRYFVYEVTGINVQNYTLAEIKKLKMHQLTELIEDYYIHEFSKKSLGNINESIEKTRKVIVRWK